MSEGTLSVTRATPGTCRSARHLARRDDDGERVERDPVAPERIRAPRDRGADAVRDRGLLRVHAGEVCRRRAGGGAFRRSWRTAEVSARLLVTACESDGAWQTAITSSSELAAAGPGCGRGYVETGDPNASNPS